jgi:hypothetical protein
MSSQLARWLWRAPLNGNVWGGVAVSHGYLLVGTEIVNSRTYAFKLPLT